LKSRRELKHLEPNEERIVEILSTIDEKFPDLVVIVEGKRDVTLLRNLGVVSRIVRTQAGRTRTALIDEIEQNLGPERQVLILTDYDEEGEEIASFLKSELELRRIKILERERRLIRNSMGNLRCIEELVVLFKRKFSPEPV
jgi:5S rRNA maturation endonuclease (ribonuclease M5)